MTIKDELETVRRSNPQGLLLPEEVVRYAKSHRGSELHKQFKWNKDQAAMDSWLETARRLIRIHVTVIKQPSRNITVRTYYAPPAPAEAEDRHRNYVRTEDVLRNPARRAALVADILGRLWSVYQSYPLEELEPVGRAIRRCQREAGIAEAAE